MKQKKSAAINTILKEFDEKFADSVTFKNAFAYGDVQYFFKEALERQAQLFVECLPHTVPKGSLIAGEKPKELSDYVKGFNDCIATIRNNMKDKGL